MRKILLFTTALAFAPLPAHAIPVTAFIGGFLNAMGAGTWLASGAVGAWTAGFSAAEFLTSSVLGRVVLSVGLSAAAQALRGKPRQPAPSERMVNYSQPLSFMERGYGRVRKGGPMGFTGFADNRRHYAVLIAAHRTKGPVTHILDNREVEIDGSGNVTTPPYTTSGTVYARIRTYRGTTGQAADGALMSAFPAQVTSSFTFKSLAYAAIWARRPPDSLFDDLYPQGVQPAYAPIWDMSDNVLDPRTGLRGWTDNLALIIAAECEFHGKTVDWSEVAAEADVCDQLVTNADGGTQKRWTCNGLFHDGMTWEEVRSELAMCGDVFFYERQDGSVGFKVGRWIAPAVTLTDADFLAVTLSEGTTGPDAPGEFVLDYVEPARLYLEATSGAYVADASSPGRSQESCYLVNSHNQASRINRARARVARAKYQLSGTIKMIGLDLTGERFVRVQSAVLGIDRYFEIGKLVRQAGGRSYTIEATSAAASDFNFTAATEEPARPAWDHITPADAIPDVAGFFGAAVAGTGGVAQVEWQWTASDAAYAQDVRWRVGGGAWQTETRPAGTSSWLQSGLIDGATYEAQTRNRTASGRIGAWAPSTPAAVVAVANSTAPAALSGVSVTPGTGQAVLAWTAPNSATYAATRIWRGAGGFGTASVVRTEYGAPSTADGFTETGVAAGAWNYWLEAINGSGIAGPRSGPHAVTIL